MWKTSVFAHVSCNLLQRLKWIADRVQQYVWQSCEVVHANICRYSECWQGPWEESGAAEGDACRCSETCISTKKGPNRSANQWHLENVNVSIYTCSVPHKPKHNTSNWDCSYHVCSVHHFLSVLCEKNYLFFPPFLKIRKKNNYCHTTAQKLLPQHGKDWVKMEWLETPTGKWHWQRLSPYLLTLGFEAFEKMVYPQHREHRGRKGWK